MSFDDIHAEDYGWVINLTVTQDDEAIDISGFSNRQMIFIDPNNTATTKIATFYSDGTDGKIKYTVEDGLIDTPGWWKVFVRLISGISEITTDSIHFKVLARED